MPTSNASAPLPADWARTLVDPEAFRHEQRRLAHVWTFLGLTGDIAKDGDWFRASIATRSVFVQRFNAELRGFENLCAHRFYPLRNADRGNGPIICGFHHWHYDHEGRAAGIPLCRELFDGVPQELGARLNQIEIAVCGTLIFGRFPDADATDTLEEFLGEGFPILAAASPARGQSSFLASPVEANWKLCLHITLDDYHIVAIHPETLGKGGYLRRKNISYVRFGAHSAYLRTTRSQPLEKMAAACRDGTFRPSHYCILHVAPNMLLALFQTDAWFWHCCIQVYDPVRHDRSIMRAWDYPAPFPTDHAWLRALIDPVRKPIVRYYFNKVFRQDNAAAERIQTVAHQIDRPPLLGALEERIDWFEQSIGGFVGPGNRAPEDRA